MVNATPSVIDEPRDIPSPLTVSVVICSYTEDRWPLLVRSVASVMSQSNPPAEIILCIDQNQALLERCRAFWAQSGTRSPIPMTIVGNKYSGHIGSARNTAAEIATGDIVAFLDDDAWAEPDWLESLVAPYRHQRTVAVGGAPIPTFEGARPRWFPYEFDWVFGCAYAGLPEEQEPVARLIGANMSVRRRALEEIGGFHSDAHDDMDLCHRLAHQRPSDRIMYEPKAVVNHFVPEERTTWRYFLHRCYWVNKGKVRAFRSMEEAASLSPDLGFVSQALARGVSRSLRQTMQGDPWGLAKAFFIIAGIGLAGTGHVVGQVKWRLARGRKP